MKKTLPAALVLILLAGWARPQSAPRRPPEEIRNLKLENINIVVELHHIQLSFLVRDSEGNFIPNLSAGDFVLMEDGQEQKIVALRERESPISAAILVDTSLSIGSDLGNAIHTGIDFFRGMEQGSAAFALFSESPRLLLDWDDPRPDLSPLEDVRAEGRTALHDSVIWATSLFSGRTGKKLIILFSDGIDTASEASFREMVETTRQAGITLYAIIHTNEMIENFRRRLKSARPPGGSVSRYFLEFLLRQNDFLEQSLRYGGRTIFSDAFADLGGVYKEIIHEMKSHYVMLYQSRIKSEIEKREVKISTRRIPGKIFIDVTH